jgi:hypothetical protein
MEYIVSKPHDSLRAVPAEDQVDGLVVQAPLRSWDGLEQFGRLVGIEVDDPDFFPPDAGAGPISGCQGLAALTIDIDDETPGLSQLRELKQLRYLDITYHGTSGANLDQA